MEFTSSKCHLYNKLCWWKERGGKGTTVMQNERDGSDNDKVICKPYDEPKTL